MAVRKAPVFIPDNELPECMAVPDVACTVVNNPAHRLQQQLLDHLEIEVANRIIAQGATYADPVDRAVTFLSRLAGPVGLVALVSALAWFVL